MPSFDTVLEPDMVKVRNSVDASAKEIATRFEVAIKNRPSCRLRTAPAPLGAKRHRPQAERRNPQPAPPQCVI